MSDNITAFVAPEAQTYTFELLAGYVDSDGVTHKDFTIREINGRDEEAISRGDIKGNKCRAASILLSRVCSQIGTLTPKSVGGKSEWEKVIKNLYVGDQDYMILKLREISVGEPIEVTHQCPNKSCNRKLTTIIDLDDIDIIPFKGIRSIEFELPSGYVDSKGVHKNGHISLPTGLDREILAPVVTNNVAKAETLMLTRLCKFDDNTPITDDVMASLSLRDRKYLQKILNDNLFGVNTLVDISCPDCGTEFTASLNVKNFI